MKHSVVGMDIAKKVFQLHTVNQCTGRIERIKLRLDEVLAFFTNYPASLVAIEACGGAHWWARQLQQQGHELRLLAPVRYAPLWCETKPMRLTLKPSGQRCNSPALAWWQSSRRISRRSSRYNVFAPSC